MGWWFPATVPLHATLPTAYQSRAAFCRTASIPFPPSLWPEIQEQLDCVSPAIPDSWPVGLPPSSSLTDKTESNPLSPSREMPVFFSRLWKKFTGFHRPSCICLPHHSLQVFGRYWQAKELKHSFKGQEATSAPCVGDGSSVLAWKHVNRTSTRPRVHTCRSPAD